jgi:hypothetical protein
MFHLKFVKTFKQVEPQLLRGLTAGLVISQRPVAYTAAEGDNPESYGVAVVEFNGYKYIENGIICGLDDKAKIVNYTSGKCFLHFDEELNADYDAKNMFAVECKGAETYLRLVELQYGDEFMTDNVNGTFVDGQKYGVKNGVIDSSVSGDFLYEEGTAFETQLPNGEKGYHFVYLG